MESRRVLTRIVDLDRDGDTDLLNGATWYENTDGFGNFAIHRIDRNNASPTLAADLDGDGDLDILAYNRVWYENLGNNRFSTRRVLPTLGEAWTEVEVFDIGGDGDLDILGFTGQRRREAVTFLENQGDGFSEIAQRNLGPGEIDVGDFDLDGRLDVLLIEDLDYQVALAQDPTPRELVLRGLWIEYDWLGGGGERLRLLADVIPASLFPEEGPGTVEWAQFLRRIQAQVWETDSLLGHELADIDGDGRLDVLAGWYLGGSNYNPVQWHRNLGDSITRGEFIADIGHGSYYLEDIDHDGDLDVHSFDMMRNFLFLNLNDGDHFVRGGSFDVSPTENYRMRLADLNGDGLYDRITGFDRGQPMWIDGLTGAFHEQGQTPLRAESSPWTTIVHEIQIQNGLLWQPADYTGDGRIDFLVSGFDGSGLLHLGTDPDRDFQFDSAGVIQHRNFTPWELLTSTPVDFDLDGDTDLVTADRLGGSRHATIHLHENSDALGQFLTRSLGVAIADRRFIGKPVFGDFNHDGQMDIVTVVRALRGNEILVHLGEGNQYGTRLVDATTTRDMSQLSAVDLDRDGDLDLLSADDGRLLFYENTGSEFLPPTTVAEGLEEATFAVFDMDGDEQLEIVVQSGDVLRIGDYQAQAFQEFAQIPFQREFELTLEAQDVDGDGDLDLTARTIATAEWFENRDGQLRGPLSVARTNLGWNGAQFVDWDQDGDQDLLAPTASNWSLHEMRLIGDSNDDGIFDSSDIIEAFTAGTYEQAEGVDATFAEGDWNQDGRFNSADLVLAMQLGHYRTA